jgi:serine/threonine protein kinase
MVFRPGPSWWVKIGDFGISKRVEDSTALRTVIGTLGFMAPEMLHIYALDEPEPTSDFFYTAAVDMWALGEIVYRMLGNQPSFSDGRQLFNYVVKGLPLTADALAECSTESIDFIQQCMAPSPRRRILADAALEHTWLRNHQYIDEDGNAPAEVK